VHARNAGLVAGLLILAMLKSRRWRDRRLLITFMSGAAVVFAFRTAITYYFWGTWLTTPHARLGAVGGWESLVAESATRMSGWLFDQEHGLLPYAPIYLLMPAGWIALWKRDRHLCADISLVVASYVAVMTIPLLNAHGWRGGWTPAARFLVPVVPLLAILVFAAVAHLPRLPHIVMVIAGVQICLDAIFWMYPKLLWNDGVGTSALLRFLDGGTGWISAYVPSIFPPLDARKMALIAIAMICWLLLTAFAARSVSFAKRLERE
jgi:hypothetical protein